MALWSAATRPHLLIPAWGCAATGAAWAAASAESPELFGWQVWLGLAAWSASAAGTGFDDLEQRIVEIAERVKPSVVLGIQSIEGTLSIDETDLILSGG